MAITFLTNEDEKKYIKTINSTAPDENGNVQIVIPDSTQNVDLTGYAKERWVQEGFQPKGDYLTAVPAGYATEEFVKNKIAEAELSGEEVDLSGYAQKSELPTKVSQLENDKGYLTEHQSLTGYATEQFVKDGYQPKGNYLTEHQDLSGYALRSELPTVPTKVSAFTNDAGYLTQHQSLDAYAKTADLGDLATKDTIAKTDLASDVRASLGKADSALQSYTETDPTVPSWAKASSKPTYTKSEVGLGNVDNVKQYSAENPPVVFQSTAPTDTSVIWVDTDDNYDDGFEEALNLALAQAKASGEFDNSAPVKGVDYFTDADKAEMVNAVIAALPVYSGEVV